MESGDTGTSVAVTRSAQSSGVRPGFFSQRKASSWEAERHGDTALHGSAGTVACEQRPSLMGRKLLFV